MYYLTTCATYCIILQNMDLNSKNAYTDSTLESIRKANRRATLIIISAFSLLLILIVYLYNYFFISALDKAKNRDEPLYFAVLFIDDNVPYGAYIGVVSSLHNRIGLVGMPKNISLWGGGNSLASPLETYYAQGGSKDVFNAIENSIKEKLTYKISVDNKGLSDIIDLIGGIRMYVEEPIEYKDENKGYYLSFDIGEWLFTGDKVLAYLHYLQMKGYEERETLYRLEDIIINAVIGFIQSPELRTTILSKSLQKSIASRLKSNLRPPDLRALADILSNSVIGTFVVEAIDARTDDRGILVPILDGRAFVKQMDDLSLYVELKTQKSELNNEDISLIVLNATGVGGLADRINIRMRYRGFSAGEYGNFSTNVNESVVLIRDGQIEKAFMVAKEGKVKRVYAKTDRRVLNNAVLILGSDYYEITR